MDGREGTYKPKSGEVTWWRVQWWLAAKRERLCMWLAERLPRQVQRWVIVQAAVIAAGNTKHPDTVTYNDMHDVVWKRRS